MHSTLPVGEWCVNEVKESSLELTFVHLHSRMIVIIPSIMRFGSLLPIHSVYGIQLAKLIPLNFVLIMPLVEQIVLCKLCLYFLNL